MTHVQVFQGPGNLVLNCSMLDDAILVLMNQRTWKLWSLLARSFVKNL